MLSPAHNEEAGAALTATGLQNTDVVTSETSDSSNEDLSPEQNSPTIALINGADLLDRIRIFLLRFIKYPSDATCTAHVLWIAHTHLIGAFFTTPRLGVLSSDPGSGKSRLLEITAMLVARVIFSVHSSPAYIVRKIKESVDPPTILCDEIDAIFGPNAGGNEFLRTVFNAGYRRGTMVGRCYSEKGKVFTEDLEVFCPVALGGLGSLPDTIASRSIIIQMQKCLPHEKVESFRPKIHEPQARRLFDDLTSWASSVLTQAESHDPILPDGIKDRYEDMWYPLLALADLAGGHWPDSAREVALELVKKQKAESEPPLVTQLLIDIRACFGGRDRLSTVELIGLLLADDEAPWGDLRGRNINPRILGSMLRPHGIKSETIRDGSVTFKGYKLESFYNAWKRYLPLALQTVTTETSVTDVGDPQKCGGQDSPLLPMGNGSDGSVTDVTGS